MDPQNPGTEEAQAVPAVNDASDDSVASDAAQAVPEAAEEEEECPPRKMASGEALGVLLVLLMLVCGAMLYHWVPGDPDVTRQYWRPSPEAVQRLEHEAAQRQKLWNGKESVLLELQQAFMQMHKAQQAATDMQSAKVAEMKFVEKVNNFIKEQGEDAYVGVGQILAASFTMHLRQLQERLAGYEGTLAEWMIQNPGDEDLSALRKLSGPFVERAFAAGLLGTGVALDMDRIRVAGVLWRGYWLQALGPNGPDRYLSRDEKLLLARFKAEAGSDLSDSRRLAMARYAEGADDYPLDLVR